MCLFFFLGYILDFIYIIEWFPIAWTKQMWKTITKNYYLNKIHLFWHIFYILMSVKIRSVLYCSFTGTTASGISYWSNQCQYGETKWSGNCICLHVLLLKGFIWHCKNTHPKGLQETLLFPITCTWISKLCLVILSVSLQTILLTTITLPTSRVGLFV